MVRGCQKKIIYLKNTGSEVFDEAFFVVRDKEIGYSDECDMVREATRILDESFFVEERSGALKKICDTVKRKIIPLLIGFVLGMTVTLLIK